MRDGTPSNPWQLKTPPGTAAYTMHRDVKDGRDILVCTVGNTVLHYDYRALHDLHSLMLKAYGDWMPLGSADEQKPAAEGTVEAWGRASDNPMGGWYGLKKGLRGRFGMYIPPLTGSPGPGRSGAPSEEQPDAPPAEAPGVFESTRPGYFNPGPLPESCSLQPAQGFREPAPSPFAPPPVHLGKCQGSRRVGQRAARW